MIYSWVPVMCSCRDYFVLDPYAFVLWGTPYAFISVSKHTYTACLWHGTFWSSASPFLHISRMFGVRSWVVLQFFCNSNGYSIFLPFTDNYPKLTPSRWSLSDGLLEHFSSIKIDYQNHVSHNSWQQFGAGHDDRIADKPIQRHENSISKL